MRKRFEILILSPFFSPNIGGVETHLDDWVNYLAQQKIEALVVTFHPITVRAAAPNFEERGSVKILRYKWFGGDLFHRLERYPVLEFLYLTPYLLFCVLWTFSVKKYHVRIIHAHGLNAAFVGLVCKFFLHIPCVLSTHAVYANSATSLMARISAKVINKLDAVLCLSEASANQMRRYGVKENKIGRFTYWVNQQRFRPLDREKTRKELQLRKRFTVLFVGRLLQIKGIELFTEVAQTRPQWDFVIVGTGPLEDKVRNMAYTSENIYFFGRQANERLPLFFNAVDAFVICSQYEEGFGRVIIEALSCGCPVVGTERGGIVEALSYGGGVLVEDKLEKIVEALLEIEQRPPERQEITKIGQRYFSQANGNNILRFLRVCNEGDNNNE